MTPIEQMARSSMKVYARMCGWTLARAHAPKSSLHAGE